MAPKHSEFRALLTIAVPVVTVQVGLMLMGVVDTLMVGRVSAAALAAVSLGNLYFYNAMCIAMGTIMALDPLVSQALGAGDEAGVTRAVQRGLVLAVLLSAPVMLVMLPADFVLTTFRQPAEVIPDGAAYTRISATSIVPFLIFVVLRQTLQAVGSLRTIVWTIVLANVLNGVLNWALIFGHLGAPAMGVRGAAIATVVSRWGMTVILLLIAWQALRPYLSRLDPAVRDIGALWRVTVLGLPIGVQLFLEVSAFAAVGLMMGVFGTAQVASHQIALNLAALTFMVPLGISAAAAVRVGHGVGAEELARSLRAAKLSYYMGGGFMCTTAVLFILIPEPLARLYTADGVVIAITGLLIPIAGMFQVFDGLQAVGAGVLRGLGDTRVPLAAMLAGYWLIGVPVSVLLGFYTELGPVGLWWGFVAGLAAVAVFLIWRVRSLFRRGVSRVLIDAAPRVTPAA